MGNDKVNEVLYKMAAQIAALGYAPERNPPEKPLPDFELDGMEVALRHAHWMCHETLAMPAEKLEKKLGMSSGMEDGIKRARALGVEIEERRLGGLWAKCGDPTWGEEKSIGIYCKAGYTAGTVPGPQHTHFCPLWRARV